MAMKNYEWRGFTYQIADEDLEKYPGAVPVEEKKKEDPKPETKEKKAPLNKSRLAKNK